MADNVTVNGEDYAFDEIDIGGFTVKVGRNKIGFGADGVYNEVSDANPLPISAAALPLPNGAATEASLAKLSAYSDWDAIAPDDANDLATPVDGIYIGGAGDIVLRSANGNDATYAVIAGQILPISPARVLATGTSATGIVGLIA